MASSEGSPLDGRDCPAVDEDDDEVEDEMLPRLARVDCKLEIEGKLVPGRVVIPLVGEVTKVDDAEDPLARATLVGDPLASLLSPVPKTMELVDWERAKSGAVARRAGSRSRGPARKDEQMRRRNECKLSGYLEGKKEMRR